MADAAQGLPCPVRATLRRAFVLIDARHGAKQVDEEIMSLLDASAVAVPGGSDQVGQGEGQGPRGGAGADAHGAGTASGGLSGADPHLLGKRATGSRRCAQRSRPSAEASLPNRFTAALRSPIQTGRAPEAPR